MSNRVGDNAPSASDLGAMLQSITKVIEDLKPSTVMLSSEERKSLLHARKDADPMIEKVLALSTKYKIEVPDKPLTGMLADQALRKQLHPLADAARLLLAMVEDTEGQAEHEMWEAFLAYYGVLSSMAARTPELALELAPIKDFMAHARRLPKAKPPSEGE